MNDLAIFVDDFRHPVWLGYVALVAHVVHNEDANIGQRHKHFTRPLFRKMGRAHRNRGEPFAGRMHEARSDCHKSLTAAAFSNHLGGAAALLPELHGAHDGKRLGGESLATKLGEERGQWVIGFMEGLIRVSDPLPEVRSEFAQVVENSGECCHASPQVLNRMASPLRAGLCVESCLCESD